MPIKPRLIFNNRYYVVAGDLLLTIASILISFALRLEGSFFFFYLPVAYWMIGISLVVKPVIYSFFGLYRRLWAYASTRELNPYRLYSYHSIWICYSHYHLFLLIRAHPTWFTKIHTDYRLVAFDHGNRRFSAFFTADFRKPCTCQSGLTFWCTQRCPYHRCRRCWRSRSSGNAEKSPT